MPFFIGKRRLYTTDSPLRGAAEMKRVSPSSPLSSKGSMTVEAALVLPLFLFFMANLLFSFEMLRLQSSMTAALHQTGRQMSEYAYFFRYALSDVIDLQNKDDAEEGSMDNPLNGIPGLGVSIALSETYVRSSVNRMLGSDYLDHTCLTGGSGGVSYLRSNIMADGDTIDLVADYRVQPLIPFGEFEGFLMQSRYYGHAFVGYGLSGEAQESYRQDEYVFITPTGTVYHRDRECSYLKPSITPILAQDLGGARNHGGGKYYACEVCNPSKSGLLYITSDGNRYHSSPECSSLKRTIYAVTLESVKDSMPPCSKCGH